MYIWLCSKWTRLNMACQDHAMQGQGCKLSVLQMVTQDWTMTVQNSWVKTTKCAGPVFNSNKPIKNSIWQHSNNLLWDPVTCQIKNNKYDSCVLVCKFDKRLLIAQPIKICTSQSFDTLDTMAWLSCMQVKWNISDWKRNYQSGYLA